MKTIVYILSLLSILSLTFCNVDAQNDHQSIDESKPVIQVIDFHSTHRCMTCNAIESQTRNTLNKHFKKEMEDGTISFLVVNVDEEKNYSLAVEFEATGTALFLNIISPEKSEKVDLTGFAFTNIRSENTFEKGLVSEIQEALKKL